MDEKKKILFIITKSNFGGAQRYVFDLATNLPKNMYDVHVACGGQGLLVTKLREAHITVHEVTSFERDIDAKKELGAFTELTRIVREVHPDTVHLNSSKAGGLGALVARLEGVPNIIFTAHGWPFYEKRNMFQTFLIWLLTWCTVLLSHKTIVVSNHNLEHAKMFGLSQNIIHIPLGMREPQFMHKQEARSALFPSDVVKKHIEDTWVVTVAEHTKNKNILKAIQAVVNSNKTAHKKIFYTLIGSGELTDTLKKYVTEHHLEEYVYFAGYVPDASTKLKAFDMLLLTSEKEGFPYVLLEAGFAELAVVASRVGGIPELIEHEVTGLLINPNDANTVESSINSLVENSDKRTGYASALKRVCVQYSLEKMVKETECLY